MDRILRRVGEVCEQQERDRGSAGAKLPAPFSQTSFTPPSVVGLRDLFLKRVYLVTLLANHYVITFHSPRYCSYLS